MVASLHCALCLLLVSLLALECFTRETGVIRIGLLLPATGSWAPGRTILGAASLAVERINADASLLSDTRLEFVWRDSECSASRGLVALTEMLDQSAVAAIIGPACSDACESTAHLTAGEDLLQVSFGCRSPLLSDVAKFPTFVRTVSSSTSQSAAHDNVD